MAVKQQNIDSLTCKTVCVYWGGVGGGQETRKVYYGGCGNGK